MESQRIRLNKEKLTQEESDLLYDIVEITDNILNKYKIKYIISGGTLLGSIRHGGFIPHDNDSDFDVLEIDLDKIRSLSDEFAKYNLVIINVPGWGLQISYKNSPDLEQCIWTDGNTTWHSKWPFLDLIALKYDDNSNSYILAGDVAYNDYPNYYLTYSDWNELFEKIKYGHLKLYAIGGNQNRINYLDRNYKNWNKEIEMLMDHRNNIYFDEPIRLKLESCDMNYRKHSTKDNQKSPHIL
jgi:phosphorylcholine metabolism protein LicD